VRLLLVHQNFPGQFRDLSISLCNHGHELRAICSSQRPHDPRILVERYSIDKREKTGIHPQTAEVDEWVVRAERVAECALKWRSQGWAPDVMLAHPGWGESLLLRQVFPASPLVVWPELWLRPEHLGINEQNESIQQLHYLRLKNWLIDGAMSDAHLAILPTKYQASTFPQRWQNKIAVVHEGIREALLETERIEQLQIDREIILAKGVPVVTFTSRNLEPMRGFPIFMRAIPELQKEDSKVQVVIVGGDNVSYSMAPEDGKTWKEVMIKELENRIDWSRVHILGRIPYEELVKLYRRSDLHVYLSNPFVLSWSVMEVMACGTAILGVDNNMMRDLIEPGKDGILWDGSSISLGKMIASQLNERDMLARIGSMGKALIVEKYREESCLRNLENLLLSLCTLY